MGTSNGIPIDLCISKRKVSILKLIISDLFFGDIVFLILSENIENRVKTLLFIDMLQNSIQHKGKENINNNTFFFHNNMFLLHQIFQDIFLYVLVFMKITVQKQIRRIMKWRFKETEDTNSLFD